MHRRCNCCKAVRLALAILASASAFRCASAAGGSEADFGAAGSDSPPTADGVLAAWQRRERQLRSFRATWVHDRTYTKYWANCHVPSARGEYVTLRFGDSVLLLDGDRMRFTSGAVDSSGDVIEFDGHEQVDEFGRGVHDDARRVFRDDRIRYDGGRPRVDPREPRPSAWPRNLRAFTTVYDGARSFEFLPAERGESPEAYWFPGSENRFRDSLHLLPLVASLRPSWLGLTAASCRIEPATQPFRGRECGVLIDESGLRREFWLDIEHDLVPLSIRMDCDVLGARMKNRIDIDYYADAEGVWLPSSWTITFLDNHGLLEQSAAATVVDAAANPLVDAGEFAITHPARTWIYDAETRAHTMVAADGGSVPISERELSQGLTHAELAARGTWRGVAGAIVTWARESWSARLALCALLAGGIAVWAQRRVVRTRTQREPINV